MVKRVTLWLAAIAMLIVAGVNAPGDEPAVDAKLGSELVGTWRQVSAKYGGKEHRFPEGITTIKHVTPAQFMWLSYDKEGNILRTAGGGYTLKGNVYEETPEYGIGPDFAVIKGKAQAFTCKIKGDRWYHTGKLSNGLTIEEVLERVKPK
jgi:hypothetical protein